MWWKIKTNLLLLLGFVFVDVIRSQSAYPVSPQSAACSSNCGQGASVAQCVQSFAGVRARANQRAFQYLSGIFREILNRELTRAVIPPISECLPGPLLSGCIQVYNLYVSRFRPPRNVAIYPSIPNKLVLSVQDLDISLTGNLGGQVNILLPVALFGIVQASVYGASLQVEVVIDKNPYCQTCMKVVGCSVTYRYIDICVQNGGLMGDMVNGPFRSTVNSMVGQKIQAKVCSMVQQVVNEKLNSKLAQIPNRISLGQMLSTFGLGSSSASNQQLQCSETRQQCFGTSTLARVAPVSIHAVALSSNKTVPFRRVSFTKTTFTNETVKSKNDLNLVNPAAKAKFEKIAVERQKIHYLSELLAEETKNMSHAEYNIPNSTIVAAPRATVPVGLKTALHELLVDKGEQKSNNNTAENLKISSHKIMSSENKKMSPMQHRQKRGAAHKSPVKHISVVRSIIQNPNVVAKRPLKHPNVTAPAVSENLQLRKNISKSHIEPAKIVNGQTRALIRQNILPVMQRPAVKQNVMVKKAISAVKQENFGKQKVMLRDRTVENIKNGTLHRQNVILHKNERARARGCPSICADAIGSTVSSTNPCAGCPGVNTYDDPLASLSDLVKDFDFSKLCNIYLNLDLLGTYASCCDYSIALSGTFSYCGQPSSAVCPAPYNFPPNADTNSMVELIISEYSINSLFEQLYRSGAFDAVIGPQTPKIGSFLRTTCEVSESKSGGGAGDLDDMFICIGDILPTFGKRYPNQAIAARIHAIRPPSVNMYARDSTTGCVTINGELSVDLCLSNVNYCADNSKIGTFDVVVSGDVCLLPQNNRIYGSAAVGQLTITDKYQSFGFKPETLQQFSVLGKQLMSQTLNQALANGLPISSLPAGSLPVSFYNTKLRLIDHALYIASDFQLTSLPQL